MKKWTVPAVCLLAALGTNAQLNIVPMPAGENSIVKASPFRLNSKTAIYYNNTLLEKDIAFFKQLLKQEYGLVLKPAYMPELGKKGIYSDAGAIYVNMGPKGWKSGHGAAFYNIHTMGNAMVITVEQPIGFFYSIQTLRQLIEKSNAGDDGSTYQIPAVSFTDYPRFAYRGMHMDVVRHFFPVSYVKKYIDYLAFHKFNTLHWHLTDDQGWRIEIKKYPKLTEVGAWRNGTIIGRYPGKGSDNTPYGGFYTQEQIKDIVQYAANRHITVIPEIELPGHSSAAIAAYPELSCFPQQKTDIPASMISDKSKAATGKLVQETWGVFEDVFCPTEYTFGFMQDVLDEVIALFPSKYIHIGGDECPKEAWKKSPFCQQLIKDKRLKDEHGLQSYFIQRIEKYINGKGRQIIGWDEILEGGLAPNATVMSWRGEEGGIAAAKQQHNVIMTPGSHCYLDHSQTKNEDSVTIGSYLPLEKVYAYEPIPKELSKDEAAYILGAQGNLWAEYITNTAKLEYMAFPRMSALAEVLWSPKEKRNWKDFERRLPQLFKWYQSQGASYSKAYFDLKATVMPAPDNSGVLWKLETSVLGSTIKYAAENLPDSKIYTVPVKLMSSGVVFAKQEVNGLQAGNSIQQAFTFNKATGQKITLSAQPSQNYSGDGAFTLVNGVQNEKGFARSGEFLGFLGTDCEAVIDLGRQQEINRITVHTLRQEASWIWPPRSVSMYVSDDGMNFTPVGSTGSFIPGSNGGGRMWVDITHLQARYVKVTISNWGEIPAGNPGAGNKAWLFTDEIEVN
jgi:hexosaminidase